MRRLAEGADTLLAQFLELAVGDGDDDRVVGNGRRLRSGLKPAKKLTLKRRPEACSSTGTHCSSVAPG